MPALIVSLPPWVGVVALVVATLAVGVSVNFYRTSRRLRERLRQTREASERQADLDAATGLASPRAFARALDLATARADRGEAAVAVVYVGVDDLRVLGNEHGTAVAQQALVALARRLQAVGGRHGVASRMGPDEFALLAHGPTAAGEEMARRTADVLSAPVEVDGHPFPLVSSVGFAVYPEHGASTRIVRMACAAMRSVRRAGGGTFAEFEPRMAEAAAAEATLARDLRHAVQRRQLTLYYQPKVDATTQQVTAAEALLRWQHPQRGMISPAVFIPLAERTGLIQEIGSWVLDEALRQAASARRALRENLERRQRLALQHLQEGAAAGGDVAHVLLDAVLGNGRQRVAAAGNAEGVGFGNGLRNGLGAVLERGELEHAHRAVPDDGAGLHELGGQPFGGLGPMSRIRSSSATSVARP
jgi:diguanylate cyclase (GGDEF)-like protein